MAQTKTACVHLRESWAQKSSNQTATVRLQADEATTKSHEFKRTPAKRPVERSAKYKIDKISFVSKGA